MENEERALFASSVARALDAGRTRVELDRALEDLGWRDALAADRRVAVSSLFDGAGRANATCSALDWLLADALGAPEDAAVVLPPLRGWEPPGRAASGRCAVTGLGSAALAGGRAALVVASGPDGLLTMVVPVEALLLRPLEGIDPSLGLVEVRGDLELAQARTLLTAEWDDALALGQLALSHELIGAARTMLELARQHATERLQFGRPIAMFQAVRHRLAESLIAIEAADSLVAGAWDEPCPVLAAMAKGMAGQAARTAAKHCQQVLAGIGFTTEHAFHHFYRRVVVLDQLLGAGSALTRQLGADVLASGALPPTFAL
jgi:Acyl-CoA dehydrogenase, C-terminal domain